MASEALPRGFGVLGDPVAHSRSPAMHEAAFAALGLPHRYLPFRVPPARLSAALSGARAMGFGGLNLTVPHKEAACPHLDALDGAAAAIGAVNTVRFEGGRAVGHNTDGAGFLRALGQLRPEPPGRCLLLGSGGAARAVAWALTRARPAPELWWASRRPERLPPWRGVRPVGYPELSEAPGFDLWVNATTVGMPGGPEDFPAALPWARLGPGGAVVDLAYGAGGGLLGQARARGIAGQGGLPMLLWQGVAALELWLGRAPLPEVAVAAMAASLGLRAGEGAHGGHV